MLKNVEKFSKSTKGQTPARLNLKIFEKNSMSNDRARTPARLNLGPIKSKKSMSND